MDWVADNLGEFNVRNIAFITISQDEGQREKLGALDSVISISDKLFEFSSVDKKVQLVLELVPETNELICIMVVTDHDAGEQRAYTDYTELSLEEPSRYMFAIFQRYFALIYGSRMLYTSADIKDGSFDSLPTDADVDALENELFGE